MPRWKELPARLGEQERQLLVQLRRMKDHSGLSLASLGAKTSYSRSSWERYLNGKKPVPRAAVEELAQVCGADPTRLLVLHEVAQVAGGGEAPREDAAAVAEPAADARSVTRENAAVSGTARAGDPAPGQAAPAREGAAPQEGATRPEGAAPARGGAPRAGEGLSGAGAGAGAGAEAGAGAGVPPGGSGGTDPATAAAGPRTVRLRTALAALALAVAVAFTGGLLTGQAVRGDGEKDGRGAFAYDKGRTYECEKERANGVRQAGYSRTIHVLLDRGSTGWEVVEAQCLLALHGFGSGAVDGAYGDSTKAAAKRFQRARDLVADGVVGPDTWRELRK
ncbi:helix-turn-helix domain-containing protein [Streptomyces longispororuber]|uniref:helix-turn-helix domain-containing protein n=1 Tax=Streptomyces longispororuber TaxID=68230 RepID=UPI0033FB1DAA